MSRLLPTQALHPWLRLYIRGLVISAGLRDIGNLSRCSYQELTTPAHIPYSPQTSTDAAPATSVGLPERLPKSPNWLLDLGRQRYGRVLTFDEVAQHPCHKESDNSHTVVTTDMRRLLPRSFVTLVVTAKGSPIHLDQTLEALLCI